VLHPGEEAHKRAYVRPGVPYRAYAERRAHFGQLFSRGGEDSKAGNNFGRRSYTNIELSWLIFVTKTVRANAVRSPLHTTRKADGKISSVIETYLDTIPKKFRPQYFNHIPVYITSGDAKGFLCNILNVTHVSAEAALKRPLDSGIILTVDHPSAVVGKLVENVPYEQVIQAAFVFPFLS
jgi:hypothetical protein